MILHIEIIISNMHFKYCSLTYYIDMCEETFDKSTSKHEKHHAAVDPYKKEQHGAITQLESMFPSGQFFINHIPEGLHRIEI